MRRSAVRGRRAEGGQTPEFDEHDGAAFVRVNHIKVGRGRGLQVGKVIRAIMSMTAYICSMDYDQIRP